mmetsp:Transcript_19059/g.31226  ORF Transcript_19059/g.31226 Transcript_19059/m.31226 type:complete len:491 (-) Transcript_19059:994-2466(-)|eukprot:CAMPEP_0184644104 /NCGR_PEP_ID=MMETSP0308-20130426/869_1 /TAXON_ID=38269 /ORGANISM="Gloeochaete witrockiana, Strain SAG 46.84" /LENGTH=490 /DNA_ID=CAMNT_0027072437 /DNA_START=84 /DNA_END=1553 /DNA_ORIENTATION=+
MARTDWSAGDERQKSPAARQKSPAVRPDDGKVGKTNGSAGPKQRVGEGDWGRSIDGECGGTFGIVLLMGFCPFIVGYTWLACNGFDCELVSAITQPTKVVEILTTNLSNEQAAGFANIIFATKLFFIWMTFQVLLARFMPGPIAFGQPTPKGPPLPYIVNGLNCLIFTIAVFCVCTFYLKLFPATIIYDNWGSLLVVAVVCGYSLSLVAYFKAIYFPTNQDNKISGNFFYDLLWGIELNPRIGKYFDFKLFFNGRPGIIGWAIFNISFAAKQYELYGRVTNSMILVNLFELTYIFDYFVGEDWYLGTLDIMLDHFGWYYAFGDIVFLPWIYDLQGYFLAHHPIDLPTWAVIGLFVFHYGGYYIFRSVNNEKRRFRETNGKTKVWFGTTTPTWITATYTKPDGSKAESKLLTNGYWGLARHFNYFGDLCMALAWCAACGVTHVHPYVYFAVLSGILINRIYRDNRRCSSKYGKDWDKYCSIVKYKLIPYVW